VECGASTAAAPLPMVDSASAARLAEEEEGQAFQGNGRQSQVQLQMQAGRRASGTLRKEWEQRTGQPWPKDPNTGGNQVVAHGRALGDGGVDTVDNIAPMPAKEHTAGHMARGDFVRWGRRGRRP
jgi:hypothetical protein